MSPYSSTEGLKKEKSGGRSQKQVNGIVKTDIKNKKRNYLEKAVLAILILERYNEETYNYLKLWFQADSPFVTKHP